MISQATGFDLPARETRIYLINKVILGVIWSYLRMISGPVRVSAVCHAVGNGIDYPLFGFGEKIGALGIRETKLYGPEVGLLPIVVGAGFLSLLWMNKSKKTV